MQNKTLSLTNRLRALGQAAVMVGLGAGLPALTGCGVTAVEVAAPVKVSGVALQGSVHGGQQPVSGANIQLYAANTTGYGSTSFALLTNAVTTAANGTFGISGDYTCPSTNSLVYLTATGGNPGSTQNNNNSAMMVALGPCGNLSSASFISVNELTTVASVYALAPFMSGYAGVSSSASNVQGLTNAFATVNKLVNTGTGTVPGPALPAFATAPTSVMNTVADILAACINSPGGAAGDGSNCGKLFTYSTVGTSVPTDTIAAVLNIARNPSQNASQLLSLSSPSAPFQPTAAVSDYTLAVKYTSASLTGLVAFNQPSASALDASGNLWVTNAGNNTVAVLTPQGSAAVGSPYSGAGLSTPSGVAIDGAGNAWVTDKGASQLSVFTPLGVGTQKTVSGLSAPTGISIDGTGLLWVTNSGSNSVAAVSVTGTTVNNSTVYTGAGIAAPVAVAISPR